MSIDTYTPITKIEGKPTNASLTLLQEQMETNARSFDTTLGDGISGHLHITVTDAIYTNRCGVQFIVPGNPGLAPIYPAVCTQAQRDNVRDAFAANQTAFELYRKVGRQLTKMLLAAVDHCYFGNLKLNGGLGSKTCLELLTHLHTNYGAITAAILAQNRVDLGRAWNLEDPIVNLWSRVTECQRLALDGNAPISEIEAVNAVLNIMEATGVFSLAVENWRLRPEDTWTMALFETVFTAADTERMRRLTAGLAGFNGANSAIETALRATIATLQATIDKGEKSASDQANSAAGTKANTKAKGRAAQQSVQLYYCWSHGYSTDPNHTGQACRHPKAGHKADADMGNPMGGCLAVGSIRSTVSK